MERSGRVIGGSVRIQRNILIGLLTLWAVLLVVFALVKRGWILPQKVDVYFVQEQEKSGTLVPVRRQLHASQVFPSPAEKIRFALEELIKGPTQQEQDAGLVSMVPSETRVLGVRNETGVVYVDFDQNVEMGGGITDMRMRLAQIVYTATQLDPVSKVRILINGKEIKSFSGEGLTEVEKPIGREEFPQTFKGEE